MYFNFNLQVFLKKPTKYRRGLEWFIKKSTYLKVYRLTQLKISDWQYFIVCLIYLLSILRIPTFSYIVA